MTALVSTAAAALFSLTSLAMMVLVTVQPLAV